MNVLSVAEARDHLVLSQSAATDAALQAVIDSAEAAIAARCGDLTPTQRTETVSACGPILLRSPVISVESVTLDGAVQTIPYPMSGLDASAGILRGNWRGDYVVTYTTGRSGEIPLDLLMGIKELVAHLWATTQRSAADRRGREAASGPQAGASYLFPHRVEQWIAPHVLIGIA